MKLTVDRIENGIIVCFSDDERKFEFRCEDVGFPVGEGSVLDLAFSRDTETEEKRKNNIRTIFERLKNKENN